MSEITDFLKAAAQKTYYDDGNPKTGEPYQLTFGPPLSPAEIAALERQTGAPLPQDLVDLLGFCSSIEGPLVDGIDLTGQHQGQLPPQQDDGSVLSMSIAVDGFGNSWEIDLTGEREATSFIWYSCHDAPVLLVQSHSLADFIREAVRMGEDPAASLIHHVHEDEVFNVWRTNPNLMPYDEALASADPVIQAFARDELEPGFLVCDLRAAPVGMGFSWGRYGAKTLIKRAGTQRVFAYAKPKPTSLLKKLFG